MAELAHGFEGKQDNINNAVMCQRDIQLEAVLKRAHTEGHIEDLIDAVMHKAKSCAEEDKSAPLRKIEAAVKQKLEDHVVDKLSAAIASQDNKDLSEAVGLAQRVHEFEAKSAKMLEAEQIMQLRPQGIWNTTHISTSVGGTNIAFDPLGEPGNKIVSCLSRLTLTLLD